MRITQENEKGQLLFWVDIELNKVDLSEFSGIDGDFGVQWEYTVAEVPKELFEEITNLDARLNPDGESSVSENDMISLVQKAVQKVGESPKASNYFLN